MRQAVQTRFRSVNRSNAETVAGKKPGSGISRPAPDAVVQRQVIVKDESGDVFNSLNFKIATNLFLSTVKGNFFDEIKQSGPELELLIFAAKQNSEKSGVTAGVTRAMVRTNPENLKKEKDKSEEDDFSSLNYPKDVKWENVTKDSPFRIEIGINMNKEAHKTPEDMAATMFHEWYVHGVNWEKKYKEMKNAEKVSEVFKDFDNDKTALNEHIDYVLGKSGMDDALGEIISLVASIKDKSLKEELDPALMKYLNAYSDRKIKNIQKAFLEDIVAHGEMTDTSFDKQAWPNLNKTVSFGKKKDLEKKTVEKKRDRNEIKEQTVSIEKNSKKKKEIPKVIVSQNESVNNN